MEIAYKFDIPTFTSLFQQSEAYYVFNGNYRVDFSNIPDNRTKICDLLPTTTPFYNEGDFKALYTKTIKTIARNANKMLNRTLLPFYYQKIAFKQKCSELNLNVKDKIFDGHKEFLISCGLNIVFIEKNTNIGWYDFELLYEIHRIHPYLTDGLSPSIVAIHQLFYTAIYLLITGNIIPRIVIISTGKFVIKWFATKSDKKVQEIIDNLETLLPDHFDVKTIKNRVEIILSNFINILISQIEFKSNDKLFNFFFGCQADNFGRKNEKQIPYQIKIWTDKLFLRTLDYKYIVIINDGVEENYYLEIAISTGKETITLQQLIENEEYKHLHNIVFNNFELLTSYISNDKIDLNQKIQFSFEQLTDFLFNNAKILKEIGVELLLPRSMHGIIRPKLTMCIKTKSDNVQSYLHLEELLDFDWRIALGDNVISYRRFLELTDKAESLIKIKNNYFYIDETDIIRIKKIMTGKYKSKAQRILQSAILGTTIDNDDVVLDISAEKIISKLKEEDTLPVPDNICAKLRPYQIRGFNWILHNSRLGLGSILADDMGLGKTLQTIVFLQQMKDDNLFADKKVLIIAPLGLIYNWKSELQRFAPNLSSYIYYGQNRNLKLFDADILISTYGILRTDFKLFNTLKWSVMVIDEAQNIKNRSTAQTQAACSICADIHIALSGTPVENNLSELWSIMNFVNPGYFGSFQHFTDNFTIPIQTQNDKERADKLRKISAPFVLRRLKTDKTIISDLPDKIVRNIYVSLNENQVVLYNQVVKDTLKFIEEINYESDDSEFRRSGLIFQMVLSLKQICNHPALYLKNFDRNSSLSGKTEVFMSLLKVLIENKQKVLIFTQFKQMGDILVDMIKSELSYKPLFLHGGCNIDEREKMVQKFQSDNNEQIFILSLKAAGTGLNLTAANHVIHFDLWWNPAVEAQATDRAYRIGQHQNVIVHRFITKNTFEEKIDNIIQQKKELADLIITAGESWIGNLSTEDLKELFNL